VFIINVFDYFDVLNFKRFYIPSRKNSARRFIDMRRFQNFLTLGNVFSRHVS
jgi:hypothetical protein